MRQYPSRPWGTVLLTAVLSIPVAGCGKSDMPALGQVSGTVTLDSQPLAAATVYFQPEVGKQSQGRTDAEGRYELNYLRETMGAVVGPHTVSILTASELAPEERLPPRYNFQTTLTAEVTPGANTIDFPLETQ